ncbi:hypothetical protein ACJMK2_012309 [Sinanodonta woodiana]|uniref:C2H2-type domain-containing protein n=1 Tax=Sinanodonta woodiana TaxID=1069815 RepID=A0ABD3V7T1_SINWO
MADDIDGNAVQKGTEGTTEIKPVVGSSGTGPLSNQTETQHGSMDEQEKVESGGSLPTLKVPTLLGIVKRTDISNSEVGKETDSDSQHELVIDLADSSGDEESAVKSLHEEKRLIGISEDGKPVLSVVGMHNGKEKLIVDVDSEKSSLENEVLTIEKKDFSKVKDENFKDTLKEMKSLIKLPKPPNKSSFIQKAADEEYIHNEVSTKDSGDSKQGPAEVSSIIDNEVDQSKPKIQDKTLSKTVSWDNMGVNRCPNCKFTTDSKSLFMNHTTTCIKPQGEIQIAISLKNNLYGCDSCRIKWSKRADFEEHVICHLISNPYSCINCKRSFASRKVIEIHARKDHPNGETKCMLSGTKKAKKVVDQLESLGSWKFTGRYIVPKCGVTETQERGIENNKASYENKSAIPPVKSGSLETNVKLNSTFNYTVSAGKSLLQKKVPKIDTTTSSVTSTVKSSVPFITVSQVPINKPASTSSKMASNNSRIGQVRPFVRDFTEYKAPVSTAASRIELPRATVSSQPVLLIPVQSYGSVPSNVLVPLPQGSILRPVTCGSNLSAPFTGTLSNSSAPRFLIPTSSASMPNMLLPLQSVSGTVMPVQGNVHVVSSASNLSMQNTTPQLIGSTSKHISYAQAIPVGAQVQLTSSAQASLSVLKTQNSVQGSSSTFIPHTVTQMTENGTVNTTLPKVPDFVANIAFEKTKANNNATIPTGKMQSITPEVCKNISGPKSCPRKFLFRIKPSHGFMCEACKKYTKEENTFKKHVWEHFHQEGMTLCKQCNFREGDKRKMQCPLVSDVVKSLKQSCANQTGQPMNTKGQETSRDATELLITISDDEEDKHTGDSATIMPLERKDAAKLVQGKKGCDDGSAVIVIDQETSEEKEMHIQIESTYSLAKDSVEEFDRLNEDGNMGELAVGSDSSEDQSPMQKNEPTIQEFDCAIDIDDEQLQQNEKEIKASKSDEDIQIMTNKTDLLYTDIVTKIMTNECPELLSVLNDSEYVKASGTENMSTLLKGVEENQDCAGNEIVDIETVEMCQISITNKIESHQAPCTLGISQQGPIRRSSKDDIIALSKEIFEKPKESVRHLGTSFYNCGFEQCSFTCFVSQKYREHLTIHHHGESSYRCDHCGHKNYSEDSHYRHMFNHASAKAFELYICPFKGCKCSTNLLQVFKNHLEKIHSKEQSFKCHYCHQAFSSVSALIAHFRENLLQFISCPFCTFKFGKRSNVLKHVRHSHPDRPKQIVVTSQLICKERLQNNFKEKDIFSSPMIGINRSIATPDADLSSESNEYDAQKDLEENLRTEHNQLVKSKIDLSFVQSNLASAVSGKQSDSCRSLKCAHCTYLAWNTNFLALHQKVHQHEPKRDMRFLCPCCPQATSNFGKLKKHISNHIGQHKVKVFTCVTCGFHTNQRCHIIDHLKDAHYERSTYTERVETIKSTEFSCRFCEYRSRRSEEIAFHESAIHANENVVSEDLGISAIQDNSKKPLKYNCQYCQLQFKHRSILRKHLESNHSDIQFKTLVTFQCKLCDFASTQKNMVLKHSLRKHSGKAARIIRKVENIDEEVELDDTSGLKNSSKVPDGMTIYLFHCDFCPFSTNSSSDLERHVSSHHNRESCLMNSDVNEYSGPKEEVPIPDGNIYKVPFQCPKCPFNNRIRINVMRHIKRHPELVPVRESSIAPSREHDVRRPSVARKSTTSRKSNLKAEASSHMSNMSESSHNNMSQDNAENPFTIVKANVAALDKKPYPLVTEESAAEKYRLGEDSLDVKLSPCFIYKGPELGNKCRICKKIIAKKYVLHRHILEHLQINFFKCHYCEHGTLEQTMLCAHIHKDHPLKSLTFQSISSKEADIHIEKKIHALELHESDSEEESENLPQNDEENEEYMPSLPTQISETLQQSGLSGHAENQSALNTRREDLVCTICNYEATTSYFFKLHLDCHEEEKEKRFGCSYCGYKTNIKRDVSRHIEKRHEGRSIRIRTYGNVSVIKQKQSELPQTKEQLITETKDQSSQEKKEFSSGAYLKCSQCNYSSNNSVVMSCHKESHEPKSEKKFGCSSCGYRANHSSNVKRHIRMCHPDKPMTVLLLNISNRDRERKNVNKKELDGILKIEQIEGNNETEAINKRTEEEGKNEVKTDLGSSAYQIRVTFKCKECGERRESKSGMYKHFTNSQCKKPWHKCDYCAFTSHAKSAIVQHTKLRHPGMRISMTQLPLSCKIRKIKCPVKQKTPSQVQEVKVDQSSDMKDINKVGSTTEETTHSVSQVEVDTDPVSELSCYLCHDFKTSSHVKMQFHLNTKHGGKTLFCMECPFKTSLFKHMLNHCKNDHQQSLARYSLRAKTAHDAQVLPRKPRPSTESHGSTQSGQSSKMSESDDISSYRCCLCEWEGKQIAKLRGHMCTHLNYKPFVCKYCGARVQYLNNVKRHIVTVHSGKELKYTVQRDEGTEAKLEKLLNKCKLLSKLPKLKTVDWHKMAKREDTYFLCKKCDYRTDRRTRIVEHYELKHGIQILNVPNRRKQTGATQPVRSPAKRPLQIETKDIPPPKEMKMDTGVQLENSMSTASLKYKVGLDPDTNQRLYECVKCSYKATAKKNLINHMTSHGVRNYQCIYCDYSAKLINNAYRHIKNVHKGMPLKVYNRKYRREMIPKKEEDSKKMGDSTSFSREKDEVQEDKDDNAAEDYVTLQGKGMLAEASQKLTTHQGHRSPRGNKSTVLKYNCNICECTITGLYHFRQHLSQHSEFSYFTKGSEIESRLSCGYCSYMAIDDVDFSRHISSHLEERPFSCGYCDFSAYRASGIRQHHANAHSDEPEKVVSVMTSSAHMAELRPIKQIMLVDCDPKVTVEKIDQLPWFRELTEGKLKVTDEFLKYGYKKLQPEAGKKRLIKRSLKDYGFETMISESVGEPDMQSVKKDQKSGSDTSEMKSLQDVADEDIKQNSGKSGEEKKVVSLNTNKNADIEENSLHSSDLGAESNKNEDEKEAVLGKEITLRPQATKRLSDSDVDDRASKKIKSSVDLSSSVERKGKINSESEGDGSKHSDVAMNMGIGINIPDEQKEVEVFNHKSENADCRKIQAVQKNEMTEDNSKTRKDKEVKETPLDGKTVEAVLANELCPAGEHSGKDTTTPTLDKVTKTPEKKKMSNIFDKLAEEMSNSPASNDYSTHNDV